MAKAPAPQIAKAPYSKKDVEDAAADARKLVADSSIIRTALTAMILSRQLYQISRSVLDTEIIHGWEVENQGLVIQTLVMSAQEKSMQASKLSDLQAGLLNTAIPFVDILLQQQRDASPETPPADDIPINPVTDDPNTTPDDLSDRTVLPGSDPGAASGVVEVLPGADGDSQQ